MAKYLIGCQDCEETGRVLGTKYLWSFFPYLGSTTCPTCDGKQKVPFGTKFKRTYGIPPEAKRPVNTELPSTYAQERLRARASSDSSSRSSDSGNDGIGLGTVVLVAALASNNSQDSSPPSDSGSDGPSE